MRKSAGAKSKEEGGGRPRRAAALTLVLLDALEDVLVAPLDPDALLMATARKLAAELECLCMIERIADGTTRVVGLAHPDPAAGNRLRASHQPHVAVSGKRAARIIDGGAPVDVHELGPAQLARYDLGDVERWTGHAATSFVAVPLSARGQSLGVLWAITTRRARRMRVAEIESVVRTARVVSLALFAANAASASRETTSTRRSVVSER